MNGDDTDLFFGKNEKDGNKDKTKEWFLKIWKMIAAFIAVIVIGGSVYSYSQKATTENSEADETENQESIISEEKTDEGKITMEESAEGSIKQSENEEMNISTAADEENTETIETETIEEDKPEKKEPTGETFIEIAEQGEGITHLARKVLKNYLAEEEGLELSKEQKIYIEDFLQNKTGTESLALGEEREFSKNLVEDAVESAQKLSDEQLKRIEQFSALAPNLI